MGGALADIRAGNQLFRTEPAWANDYDKDSCETWERNVLGYYKQKGFSGNCKVFGDVRKIDFESLADVDGLMFGFLVTISV